MPLKFGLPSVLLIATCLAPCLAAAAVPATPFGDPRAPAGPVALLVPLFQTIEQAVTLPEGFQAFEAEVQVRSSKLRFPMQQSFPWKPSGQPVL